MLSTLIFGHTLSPSLSCFITKWYDVFCSSGEEKVLCRFLHRIDSLDCSIFLPHGLVGDSGYVSLMCHTYSTVTSETTFVVVTPYFLWRKTSTSSFPEVVFSLFWCLSVSLLSQTNSSSFRLNFFYWIFWCHVIFGLMFSWRYFWCSSRSHGIDIPGCRDIHTWPHYFRSRCKKGLWRHGCL